jgi:hypothetical protein
MVPHISDTYSVESVQADRLSDSKGFKLLTLRCVGLKEVWMTSLRNEGSRLAPIASLHHGTLRSTLRRNIDRS